MHRKHGEEEENISEIGESGGFSGTEGKISEEVCVHL